MKKAPILCLKKNLSPFFTFFDNALNCLMDIYPKDKHQTVKISDRISPFNMSRYGLIDSLQNDRIKSEYNYKYRYQTQSG